MTAICEKLIINSTTNYDQFRFYPSNRPASHWAKIAQSIEKRDLTPFNPIICARVLNKQDFEHYYWVIDGQNRFKACQHLGLPIWFVVVPDGDQEDIALLNTYQVNWSSEEYLHFFVSRGFTEYLKVQHILADCDHLTLGDIFRIHQYKKDEYGSTIETFRHGKYQINKAASIKCMRVNRLISAILTHVPDSEVKRLRSLVNAFSSLVTDERFDDNRMIEQIEKYAYLFRPQAAQDQYKEVMEDIYNYRKRDKVSFRYS